MSLVNDHGIIIVRKSDIVLAELIAASFQVIDIEDRVAVALRRKEQKVLDGQSVLIVVCIYESELTFYSTNTCINRLGRRLRRYKASLPI